MRVEKIQIVEIDEECEISGWVSTESVEFPDPKLCWFRFGKEYASFLSDSADIFLATLLLPAMLLGEDLVIEGMASEQLLKNAEKIQAIYRRWLPAARKINIVCQTVPSDELICRESRAQMVGCFFSGGVDSFYSSLKNFDEITHLLMVSGFDGGIRNPNILGKTRSVLGEVALASGKKLLEIKTNIREIWGKKVDWGFYHGAVLGGIALSMAPGFKKIIVPSSYDYGHLHPWGSHPLLDPLWSDGFLEVIHDGCEATRYEKIGAIAKSKLALSALRVCSDSSPSNSYNCGQCEKCVRTMLALHLHGVLDECSTFTGKLTPKSVRKIGIKTGGQLAFAQEILNELKKRGSSYDRALCRSLEYSIRFGVVRKFLRGIKSKIKNSFG